MALDFEWDSQKAEANLRKHAVSFEEAATTFGDPLGRLLDDPEHSGRELRYVLFGRSEASRLLAVMHTECGAVIRLISAREATPHERRQYARFHP